MNVQLSDGRMAFRQERPDDGMRPLGRHRRERDLVRDYALCDLFSPGSQLGGQTIRQVGLQEEDGERAAPHRAGDP
jgi:hypothetical protein